MVTVITLQDRVLPTILTMGNSSNLKMNLKNFIKKTSNNLLTKAALKLLLWRASLTFLEILGMQTTARPKT